MRALFLCCLLCSVVWTQEFVSEPKESLFWRYYHLASVGYRRDRQSFSDPLSSLRIEERNSAELILRSHLETDHGVLYVQGSYGWLIDGNLDTSLKNGLFGSGIDNKPWSLGAGYSAEAVIGAGIKIPIIQRKSFLLHLIPMGGYRYSHLMNFPQEANRADLSHPSALFVSAAIGFVSTSFLKSNQQDWFGLFGEARLQMLFFDQIEWTLFYQYHRPCMRSVLKEELNFFLFDGAGSLSFVDLAQINTSYKVDTAKRQTGGMNLRYHGTSAYSFGLHFEASYAFTPKARAIYRVKEDEASLLPLTTRESSFDTKADVKWVNYGVSIYLGYQF